MGSPLFMEEGEDQDEVEWSDARSSLPPSFLERCASSLRSLLGSAKLRGTTPFGWVKEGGKAGGRAVRAACQSVVEGGETFVAYISS